MKVKLQAGAELDVLTASELHEELELFQSKMAALMEGRIPRRLHGQDVADANGVVIIDLGAPELRREWELRSIRLVRDPPGAVKAAQNALLFISSAVPSHALVGAAGLGLLPYDVADVMFGLQVPWGFTYTGNAQVAKPDEHIWVCITGTAGVGESYIADASVLDGPYQLRAPRDVRA